MPEVYKVISDASKYPNGVRVCKLELGDSFYVRLTDKQYIVGEEYEQYPGFTVTKIFYEPKKWWQIWKKRKAFGCVVTKTK